MLTPEQKLAVAHRRKRVAELRLECVGIPDIAAQLGVSGDVVDKDLKAVRKEWEKARAVARDAWVAQEWARIDAIEKLAREGWKRSCQDAEALHVRTETEGKKDRDGNLIPTKTMTEKTTKGQCGDPRYLERIAWCVEQRLKVVGGYAPKELRVSDVSDDEIDAAVERELAELAGRGQAADAGAAPGDDRPAGPGAGAGPAAAD